MKDDPYHDIKKIHAVYGFTEKGKTLPICRKTPVNLKKETWTLRSHAVTCKKCLLVRKKIDEANAKSLSK